MPSMVLRPRVRLVRDLVLVVVLDFVVPLGGERDDPVLWVRLTIVLIGFALVSWSIGHRILHELRDGGVGRGVEGLLVSVVVGVAFSALADHLVAPFRPGEFTGLSTRLDAMYFALSTLTTVGYGDIHPVGQLARAVVGIQMVFNVAVLATAAGLAVRGATDRLRQRPR